MKLLNSCFNNIWCRADWALWNSFFSILIWWNSSFLTFYSKITTRGKYGTTLFFVLDRKKSKCMIEFSKQHIISPKNTEVVRKLLGSVFWSKSDFVGFNPRGMLSWSIPRFRDGGNHRGLFRQKYCISRIYFPFLFCCLNMLFLFHAAS